MNSDLIARAQAGDEEAFRHLVERHRRELEVHCYRLLGSPHQTGRPVFHYERQHRPDGSFWYAHRVPHVTIKVVYTFPDDDFPANKDTESLAHGQTCALTLDQSYALHALEKRAAPGNR